MCTKRDCYKYPRQAWLQLGLSTRCSKFFIKLLKISQKVAQKLLQKSESCSKVAPYFNVGFHVCANNIEQHCSSWQCGKILLTTAKKKCRLPHAAQYCCKLFLSMLQQVNDFSRNAEDCLFRGGGGGAMGIFVVLIEGKNNKNLKRLHNDND